MMKPFLTLVLSVGVTLGVAGGSVVDAQASVEGRGDPRVVRERLPAGDGPIPAGYHPEETPHIGIIVPAGIVWVLAYLNAALGVGASFPFGGQAPLADYPLALIPVAGPFIAAVQIAAGTCSAPVCEEDDGDNLTILLVNGAVQVAAATAIVLGAVLKRKVWVRDPPFQLRAGVTHDGAYGGAELVW
jgi:hypothetical protein